MILTAIVYLTIAYEASNQSVLCQQWVAKTIAVRSIERNLTPEEVCLQRFQFSCWDKGKPTQKRRITKKEKIVAQHAWMRHDEVKARPNLYHDTSVNPAWSRHPKVKFLKQIGTVRFYREERG